MLYLYTELARDYLTKKRGWNVMGGIISPVHIAYGKKVLTHNEVVIMCVGVHCG